MHQLTSRLMAALFTFMLGAAAAALWVNRPAGTEIMPAGKWEAIYFPTINARTDAANLPGLRTVDLPSGDLEVRVWIGFGTNGEDGIILRRSSNQWSALFLHGMYDRHPPAQYQRVMTR